MPNLFKITIYDYSIHDFIKNNKKQNKIQCQTSLTLHSRDENEINFFPFH